ncbi:MAG: hypothetical protein U1F43_01050 [Myxococcota bacterium]
MPNPLAAAVALAAVLGAGAAASAAGPTPRAPTADAVMLPNGLALPYPTLRVFRAFGPCLGRGKHPEHHTGVWHTHDHEGLDLGGLGPDGGLGSAVRSLTHARVTSIGRTDDDPPKYGYPDRREGDVDRGGIAYPRAFTLAGYGEVHFFTRAKGYWKTGNMVVTVGVGGPLDGFEIRYLHLGAARPDLVVGAELAPGEEVGVLGGTSVQDSAPHVHIDIRDPDGEAVDVAPLIGLVPSAWCGIPRERALRDAASFRAAAQAAAKATTWRPDSWAPPVGARGVAPDGRELPTIDLLRTPPALVASGLVAKGARFWNDVLVPTPCAPKLVEEDFSSGAYAGHAWRVPVTRGMVLDVQLAFSDRDGAPTFALVAADRVVPAAAARTDADPIVLSDVVFPPLTGGAKRTRVSVLDSSDLYVDVLAPEGPSPETGYRLTVTQRCVATVGR